MPSAAVPVIPILGFTTPVVKPDAVVISARLGGGLYQLRASPSVWRLLLSELADAVGMPGRPVLPNDAKHAAEKPALAEQAPDPVRPVPAPRSPLQPLKDPLPPVLTPSPGSLKHLSIRSAERDELFRAHWRRFIAEPGLTMNQVAEEAGVTRAAVHHRFWRFRAEPGAPVLRPNGKL